MRVMKFGGTSVGDAQCFANVAHLVQEARSEDRQIVVVVSAMSGVTDDLIQAARAAADGDEEASRCVEVALLARHVGVVQTLIADEEEQLALCRFVEERLRELEKFCRSFAVLGEVTARGLDAVTSIGERLAARILAAVLSARGPGAEAVDATRIVITDDHFGAARPLMAETRTRIREELLPLLEKGVIPVVTGYLGATIEGVTTTLGRGGSDYTAAIVGACLDADEVWIWSDVDGILTADPNIVPQARTLKTLSYVEAAQLAYFGADVLHPKTVKPVLERAIPLRILNTFNPSHPGTLIVKETQQAVNGAQAIISTRGLSLIAVAGEGETWTPEVAARVLSRLAGAGVDVLMFSQSFSERSLNLVVRQADADHTLKVLGREFREELAQGAIAGLEVQRPVATISVVGAPGGEGTGIVLRTFAALGKCCTRVISIAQSASEYNVSFVVHENEVDDTVRFIHRELGLEV